MGEVVFIRSRPPAWNGTGIKRGRPSAVHPGDPVGLNIYIAARRDPKDAAADRGALHGILFLFGSGLTTGLHTALFQTGGVWKVRCDGEAAREIRRQVARKNPEDEVRMVVRRAA